MIDEKYLSLYPDDDETPREEEHKNTSQYQASQDVPGNDLDMIIEPPVEAGHNESIIKVIGVGGGGGNAVLNMFKEGIKDVDFIICNTDRQVLEKSPIPNKIQLGAQLTKGLGAGNDPKQGREAAKESIEEIREAIKGAQMIFVTAGMGGGTGTGAAPIVAQLAKEMGVLTVGIVTLPFRFEGPKRITQAVEGIRDLQKNVDALLLIDNERITEVYSDFKIHDAFRKADEILTIAAKGIAEIITLKGTVNVDFADVRNVLKDSGLAIMGTGYAKGEARAKDAVRSAIYSPLLNFVNIRGASRLLFNITSTEENQPTTAELREIADFIKSETRVQSDIIWGTTINEEMDDTIAVTVIATGFETDIEQYLNKIASEVDGFEQEKTIVTTTAPEETDDNDNAEAEQPAQPAQATQPTVERQKYSSFDDLKMLVEQLPNSAISASRLSELKKYEKEPAFIRLGMSVREEQTVRQGQTVRKIVVVGSYHQV